MLELLKHVYGLQLRHLQAQDLDLQAELLLLQQQVLFLHLQQVLAHDHQPAGPEQIPLCSPYRGKTRSTQVSSHKPSQTRKLGGTTDRRRANQRRSRPTSSKVTRTSTKTLLSFTLPGFYEDISDILTVWSSFGEKCWKNQRIGLNTGRTLNTRKKGFAGQVWFL